MHVVIPLVATYSHRHQRDDGNRMNVDDRDAQMHCDSQLLDEACGEVLPETLELTTDLTLDRGDETSDESDDSDEDEDEAKSDHQTRVAWTDEAISLTDVNGGSPWNELSKSKALNEIRELKRRIVIKTKRFRECRRTRPNVRVPIILEDLLELCIPPNVLHMLQQLVDSGLDRRGQRQLGNFVEFAEFLEQIVALAAFHKTPTALDGFAERPHMYSYRPPVPLQRFMVLLRSLEAWRMRDSSDELSSSTWDDIGGIDTEVNTLVKTLNMLWAPLFFVKSKSIMVVDDDKMRCRARDVSVCGATFTKEKGSVMHTIASTVTGCIASMLLQGKGMTSSSLAKELLLSAVGESRHVVNLSGTLICADRGYWSTDLRQFVLDSGGHFLSTVPRNKVSRFVWGQRRNGVSYRATANQRCLSTIGASTVCFADETSECGRPVYHFAFRVNRRFGLVQTSLPVLRDTSYVASYANVTNPVDQDLKRNVRILTLDQDVPNMVWFSLRRGLFTSTSTYKLLRGWVATKTREELSSYLPLLRCFSLSSGLRHGESEDASDSSVEDECPIPRLRPVSDTCISELTDGNVRFLLHHWHLPVPDDDIVARQLIQTHKDDLADKLVRIFNKQKLVDHGKGVGIRTGGRKSDIATRIVESSFADGDCRLEDSSSKFRVLILNVYFSSFAGNESTRLGKANERFVVRRLAEFVQKHSNVRISDVTTLGLVASRTHSHIATSVDGLCRIEHPRFGRGLAAVEIKTRVSRRTASLIATYAPVYDVTISELHEHISEDASHRLQCVHHAFVIGAKFVLYVEATTSAIQRVIICRIEPEELTSYGSLIDSMYFSEQDIFDYIGGRQSEVPQALATLDNFGLAGDLDSVVQTRRLRDAMGQVDTSEVITRLVPTPIYAWNALKNGVDTMSRWLSHSKCYWQGRGYRGFIFIRLLFVMLLQVHHCMVLVKTDMTQLERQPNVTRIKAQLRKVGSFGDTLDHILGILQKYVIRVLSGGSRQRVRRRAPEPGVVPVESNGTEDGHVSIEVNFNTPPRRDKRTRWVSSEKTDVRLSTSGHHPVKIPDQKRKNCVYCGFTLTPELINGVKVLKVNNVEVTVPVSQQHLPVHSFYRKVTHKCTKCNVALCLKPRPGANQSSCWELFHSEEDLQPTSLWKEALLIRKRGWEALSTTSEESPAHHGRRHAACTTDAHAARTMR